MQTSLKDLRFRGRGLFFGRIVLNKALLLRRLGGPPELRLIAQSLRCPYT